MTVARADTPSSKTTDTLIRAATDRSTARSGRWDDLARRLVFAKLGAFSTGLIRIVEEGQAHEFGTADNTLEATVHVHDPRFYRAMALGGSLGAAEAYIDGQWSTDDLIAVCRIAVRNGDTRQDMEKGWARLGRPLNRLFHSLRRNTHAGSRRNIAAHYDLGNDFFRLFLDETLMYSSAIFPHEDASLAEASTYKNERICRKLDLKPSDHLLEIGTGWGGFALHAASHYGCRITSTTISSQQYELARERIAAAGLADRVEVVLEDYRDLKGHYDKLVSIEMIEAVGHHYYDAYFGACGRLLKPDGLMLLQSITISDWVFPAHTHTVDFIKRYIFPGSCVPSVAAISASIAQSSDMRIAHLEDIGPHYARTLATWRDNFLANIDEVRALGLPEEFIRMWDYYFCYCVAGFTERYISDAQILLARPQNRRAPILPDLAAA